MTYGSMHRITEMRIQQKLKEYTKPFNLELYAAHEEGHDAVQTYKRAQSDEQIILNQAKLILVGEGEVGKTCLMDALEGVGWREHDTTHGIQIRSINVVDPESGTEITLNGWDFGGQHGLLSHPSVVLQRFRRLSGGLETTGRPASRFRQGVDFAD